MSDTKFLYYKCKMQNNLWINMVNVFYHDNNMVIKIDEIPQSDRHKDLKTLALRQAGNPNSVNSPKFITVSNLEAFSYRTWLTSTDYDIVSFKSPDKKYLISISYGYGENRYPQEEITNKIIKTFSFSTSKK